MSKQTSIEWLVDQLFKQGYFDGNKPLSITNLDHLQHQAKAIHRVEIMQAVNDGKRMGFGSIENLSLEQYYEKEFT